MLIRLAQDRHEWTQRVLRLAAVAGMTVLCAYLAPRSSPRLLFLLAGGVAALVLFSQPWWGLVLLIPASLLAPVALDTGTGTPLNVTILLLLLLTGLWLLDMLIRQKRVWLVRSPLIRPLLGLAVAALLGFGAGQLGWFGMSAAPLGAQLGGLSVFILSAAAFLLVAHQVRDPRRLEWMIWPFLVLGGVYAAGQALPWTKPLADRIFQPGSTASLFWVWLGSLALGQVLGNQDLKLGRRLALTLLLALTLYVAVVRELGWVSGWLPAMAGLLGVLWAARPRLALLATAVAVPVVLFASSGATQMVLQQGGDYGNEWSLVTRMGTWGPALKLAASSPIFGFGPANYSSLIGAVTTAETVARWMTLNPDPEAILVMGKLDWYATHNQYLDLLLQTGLLGLSCFVWFAWQAGRLGWRLRRLAPPGFARGYVYGCVGGLAGTLVAGMLADWILPYVYTVTLVGMRSSVVAWLFLGGLVALEQIMSRRPGTAGDELG